MVWREKHLKRGEEGENLHSMKLGLSINSSFSILIYIDSNKLRETYTILRTTYSTYTTLRTTYTTSTYYVLYVY